MAQIGRYAILQALKSYELCAIPVTFVISIRTGMLSFEHPQRVDDLTKQL